MAVEPEYYLNVDFAVAESGKFEELMGVLLKPGGVFARSGWSLVLALRSLRPYRLRSDEVVNDAEVVDGDRTRTPNYESYDKQLLAGMDPKTATYTRYVHLWRLPRPFAIAEVMRSLGEDDDYIKLDALVEREVQELLFSFPAQQLPSLPTKPPESDGSVYVYARREFPSLAISQYLSASVVSSIALRTKENEPWQALGFLRTATGNLNYITEFWKTSVKAEAIKPGENDVHTLAAFEAALRGAPGVLKDSDLANATSALLRQEFRFPMTAINYR